VEDKHDNIRAIQATNSYFQTEQYRVLYKTIRRRTNKRFQQPIVGGDKENRS
jgi:hypothetical protein